MDAQPCPPPQYQQYLFTLFFLSNFLPLSSKGTWPRTWDPGKHLWKELCSPFSWYWLLSFAGQAERGLILF